MDKRVWVAVFLSLAIIFLQSFASTWAQDGGDPDMPTEIEAEMQQLARIVHISDLRDPGGTRWVGGNIGLPSLFTEQPAGRRFDLMSFETWTGKTVKLDRLERPLLINFWASWCGPCVYEFPALIEAAFQLQHADIWFVNTADQQDEALAFLETVDVGDIPSYVDSNDAFNQELGIVGYPTTILLDTDGTLLVSRTGTITPAFMTLVDLVAAYPNVGTFDASSVPESDIRAQIDPVDTSTALPIEFGERVFGTLTHEQWQVNYLFEATAGQQVGIGMVTLEEENPYFDPYLVLIGPDGSRLIENDDGPEPPHALLTTEIPEDGEYVVVATRLLEAESLHEGRFGLIIVDLDELGD